MASCTNESVFSHLIKKTIIIDNINEQNKLKYLNFEFFSVNELDTVEKPICFSVNVTTFMRNVHFLPSYVGMFDPMIKMTTLSLSFTY